MCLLIVAPDGVKLTKEEIKTANKNNPHGIGIAYYGINNKMNVIKNIEIKDAIDFIAELKKTPCIIHFRLASRGTIEERNCHPFEFNDWVMAHNGTLPIVAEDGKSDTLTFAEKFRDCSFDELFELKNDIENFVGPRNKICFFHKGGEKYFIINEKEGFWENGIWFSNRSHLEKYCSFTKVKYISGLRERIEDLIFIGNVLNSENNLIRIYEDKRSKEIFYEKI
ncbi:MAG: class II glutamine amidotransferase [Thermoplasmata archaeon]